MHRKPQDPFVPQPAPTFEVSGDCTVKDRCVYSGNFGPGREYSQDDECVIKQTEPFPLEVHSFDVEDDLKCKYDSLKVNGVKYCGTNGPQGVTPAAGSALVWYTDFDDENPGFKICAVSRQPPRHTSSDCGPWHKICGLHTCTPHRSSDSSPPHTSCLLPLLKYALAHTTP